MLTRFESYICPEPNTGCWIWMGSTKGGSGYGQIFRAKGTHPVRAHVYSYEHYTGKKVPKGMDLCHTCDNRWCVNPDHLFVGTRLDNMQDAKRKGRTLAGERCAFARLTQEQCNEIRDLLSSGVHKREIAERFGVSWSSIHRIERRKTWTR